MPSSLGRKAEPEWLDGSGRLTELLLEWQAVGEADCFEQIVAIATPVVLRLASRTLAHAGLRSRSHCDDVLSLVLDHLRRLHAPARQTASVARFTAEPDGNEESGLRYVSWLSLARTRDVIRSERRHLARQPNFTDLQLTNSDAAARGSSPELSSDDAPCPLTALRAAIDSLDGGARDVVEMLLAGRTQKQIADALGVCEGTVSRRKDQVFLQIRDFILTTAHQRQAGMASECSW